MKPPIGIIPNWLWREFLEMPDNPTKEEIENRITELKEAVFRYHSNGIAAPPDWGVEINILNNMLLG